MSSSKSSGVSSSSVAEQTPGSAPNICHTCTEPITTPQFIRVGAYKFHKDHFTCSICSTSLHEKKFHHKDSKFYCADDYVNKFCHTCRHCKQKIATGSVIQAFDGYYHPEHFVCVECNRPFKNGKYYEANDQPYCDEHYFLLTAEKCQTCGLGVQEAEIVRVQGKVFHSHCLSCCHCGLPLAKKGSIFQKDGKTYCLAEDHQILTDQGFLFLDQVRKLQQSTDSTLRFASYDSHTQQLQYLPSSRLIDNPPDLSQSMVEFTSTSEAERWSDDADVYGRSASSNRKSSATSQLSLLVTGEHDMFVRRAGRVNHSKVLAKRLVNTDENISFLSCATGGLAAFENMEIPLAVELGLSTQEEIHALLAVYGAWIGFNLSVATPSSSPESIELPLSSSSSRTWLLRHFSSLRMIEGIDFQFTHTLCHIISRSYVNLFYTLPLDSLPSWVWQLGRSAAREMVDGWRQMTATPAEHDEITSHNQLRAYSTRSRDDAQRLCLHGGYATQFDVSPNTTDSSSLIWCITFFDSALAPLTAEPILQPGEIRSLEKGSYTGRTWCVTVPTGLIVVRRAATDIDGQVTKASQPTIIGNCRNDYLNFFCKRCTACAEHILKHCIAGRQSVNLVSGESRPIEHVDAETPILAHDGHGLIGASHEGVLLQPNERECVTLVFADGRSITCTPEHRVLTPNGYVPAESLTPGLSTVLTSVRFPSLTRPSSKEQRKLEDSFQFESPVLSSIHMRDDFNRKRALAFARVAGYVFQQPTDEMITFTTHLDAVSFQRDIDLVMSTVETIDRYDSLTLTVALPSPVTSALLTILSPSSQFFHPLDTPISIHRAFLSGRISRSGGIDIADHQFTIRWPTDIAHDSMRSAQLESTTSPRILEAALAFTYSSHQQERLAIAASYEGVIAHADKPTQTAVEYIQFTGSQSFFKELQLTDNHTHTHSHHTHRHHATHSSKHSSSYGTFELSLTSVSSAGFHSVYDVVNSAHESFQVEGVCVHNCVSVNDEYYHPACLVCSHCGCKLDKYISISGYLRCNEHTELPVEPVKCSVCTKIVDGEVVLSVGKKVHPECFKCQLCGAGLQKATAKLKDDKLCCNDCMMKRDPSLMAKNAAAANGVAPEGETPIQVDSRPSTSSTTSAAAGVAVSSPKPIDHDEFTKYEKPTRSRKPSKALPQGKIEWKKGELIGKGSFGKVYMAMNSATGELIAVKQVRLNTAEEQEQAAAIQNEIGLMENLRHPNIVSLLGTQRNGNKLNILMEYVPGKSLDSLLEKFGGFSEKVIRSYTKQLLEALAYCHANRVVHRDIKGKNILVNTQGNLKLADFGSAKRFTNVMSKDAPSLSYNYTPLWTAPEVLTGDYNSKIDIWSLGCVIIEMSSAKPPWSEQNFENPFRALYHIGNSDAIPKIPETLSETGINFVKQCLRRNPDERPDAAYLLKQEWLSGIESLPNNSDDSSSDGEDHASDSD